MATMVEQLSRTARRLLLIATLCLAPTLCLAQQSIVPFQLSFSDPGARSMGFGGAFVALADDATAAFSNPAGLVQLIRPEVSIEGRSWSHSTPYTVGGRLEGSPSGSGIDSIAGIRTGTSEYDATGVSFLSVAFPKGKWSFALFRHEYADIEFTGATQGLFGGGTECCQTRWNDQQMISDLGIVSYGLSVGYRLSDQFYVGLGAVNYDASLLAGSTEYLWDDDTWESFIAPTSYLPERSVISETLFVDDNDWALSAGLLWRPTERWTFGGVYRQGLNVDIGVTVRAGQAVDYGVPPGSIIAQYLNIPISPIFSG